MPAVAHPATVTFADVVAAAGRIEGLVHRTPVVTSARLNQFAGGHQLFLKCENLQRTGSFKVRGATHAIACLDPADRARGVVTHSSGNHAQALACAARAAGLPAWVVMPAGSSAVKQAAVLGYGGRVISCANNERSRIAVAAQVEQDTGANLIPPFDDARIIAGQGTAALELLEQVPDLDLVIAPVGGGGLLAGTCLAVHGKSAGRVPIYAAEPAGAADAWQSFQQGERIPLREAKTIADGLRTSVGLLNWPIIREHVRAVVTVEDAEIVAAMRACWINTKLVIEPSSAVPLAALRKPPFTELPGPQRIGVIISGGNVDLDALPW
jgi:threonine dehydratase